MFDTLRIAASTLVLGTTLLFSDLGAALPAFYSPWPSIKLNNPQGLSYLRDHKDARVIWVKPPRMGAEPLGKAGLSHHRNHALCQSLAQNLRDLSANTELFSRSIEEIKGHVAKTLATRRAQRGVAMAITQTLEKAGNPPVGEEIVAVSNTLGRNKLALVDITHRVDACRTACDELYWQKFYTETAISESQADIARFKRSHPQLAGELVRLGEQLWEHRLNEYEVDRSRRTSQNHLFRAERRIFKSYAKTAVRPAGMRRISYRLHWSDAINSLAKLNPAFTFKAIPVRSLRLRARHVPEKIDDFYLSTLPGLIGFEGVSAILKNFGSVDVGGKFSVAAVDDLEGDFTFTLNGACPFVDDDFAKALNGRVAKGPSGRPLFSATLTYAYLVKLPKALAAKFNPLAVYKAIRETIESSGYFSREAAQSLLDHGALDAAIKLPADVDKPTALVLKQEALNRVLAGMMTVTGDVSSSSIKGGSYTRVQAGEQQTYGKQVAGWELLKGKALETAEKKLAQKQSGWQDLTFGEGDLMALTGIALFNGVASE